MTDDDWARLARRMGEVANAPLFIDDSPNMSMMEIRAKCRRLKQQHDLKLVIVDYLQLMSSPGRVESRQQEVSEMSRSLKLLAKELEVPVVALSQLNRGPEQRTDKRPQVSDLRESGCLTADTRILRADTGAETTLGELYESGERDIPVWSLDEKLRMVPRTMSHVFSSGVKETFLLRLASGREVKASANHPFLAFEGWRRLEDFRVGDRVAVPRHVPAPRGSTAWPESEVVLLAHIIGDGSSAHGRLIRYTGADEENLAAVTEAARHFGVTAVREGHRPGRDTALRLSGPAHNAQNPVAAWLDGLGLLGLCDHERFVPDAVFTLPTDQIALFLRHLWAAGGSIRGGGAPGGARVHYTSGSRRLVDGMALLLARLGIMTRIGRNTGQGSGPSYVLDIHGADQQRLFAEKVGCLGSRSKETAGRLAGTGVDTVPRQVWDRAHTAIAAREAACHRFSSGADARSGGSAMRRPVPSGGRLTRIAAVLDDADLDLLATNDVFWDEVVSVDPLGEEEVFDATVAGTHNFVANGIGVHNSIEQDADMVILLYREDVHDKESPRAGEADIIVAKHRNGPTADVTVAFQGHYSRFVDMAPG